MSCNRIPQINLSKWQENKGEGECDILAQFIVIDRSSHSSKQVFLKLYKFHRKAPLLESLFNKVPVEICEIFKNTFFYRTSQVAASVLTKEQSFQMATLLFKSCEHWFPVVNLLVQSQQQKDQKNARNLFKDNNKDTRTYFIHCSIVALNMQMPTGL